MECPPEFNILAGRKRNKYISKMKLSRRFVFPLLLATTWLAVTASAQTPGTNDSNPPLFLTTPDYPVPYGPPKPEKVVAALDRIYLYVNSCTPTRLMDKNTKAVITDLSQAGTNAVFEPGAFRLVSYEWGIVYGAMLSASRVTGDPKYAAYATDRINFLADLYPRYQKMWVDGFQAANPYRRVFHPQVLDDCGSMCAGLIKVSRLVDNPSLRPMIDGFATFIANQEYRLADGTLARNRPHPNSLWLDDMYMSIPALAQMGALTGDQKYFDDATRQVRQFSSRMFVKEAGLYRHGWVEGMADHPAFFWGRANGWAVLALCELLDVLPASDPNRAEVLEIFRAHMRGIVRYQNGSGFWHQLLDRNDSYPETSATAMFTYGLAHGINQGWLDPAAYGPAAIQGWNALSTKITAQGQVEGTCVGTGMGFDPAFYYHRPTSPLAAHGYGPTILAGSEILNLLKNFQVVINESSVMVYRPGVDWKSLKK